MTENRTKTDALKENMDKHNISLHLFKCKGGDFIFLDSEKTKIKLKRVYEISYDNIETTFKTEDYSKALSYYQDKISSKIHKNKDKLSLLVFGKKAYEVSISNEFFLDSIEQILKSLENQDIVVYAPSFEFGLCLLIDEHSISIAIW